MIDIQEKKNKIISFLNDNGPSLPIVIARAIEMDTVFASAIMSEMLGSKQIKTSYMKIGASPLYLLPGQEQELEKKTEHLKSVEKEAYLKIKEQKIINDDDESPAIRVALRNIKDFATPFKFKEKIMWRYMFATDDEVKKLLSPAKTVIEKTPEEEKNELVVETKKPATEKNNNANLHSHKTELPKMEKSKKIENIFTAMDTGEKELEFLTETKKFLKQKNIEFIEEIRTEKKEIMAIVSINSQLGKINFLLIAKNKKTVTRDEIDAAMQIATKNRMPCLLIIRKNPSNPIQKLIDKNHLIKLEIMNNRETINL